jgi:hypothetical protein
MTAAHDRSLDPIETPRTSRAPVAWRDRHALKIGAGLLGVITTASGGCATLTVSTAGCAFAPFACATQPDGR